MKKLLFGFLSSILALSIFFVGNSLAQTPRGNFPSNPFFNTSSPAVTSYIQYGEKAAKTINLPPFSQVVVPAGSFNDNVTVYVFQGNWDKIKSVLPTTQSPISSFYLVFIDSKGKMVLPSNEITVKSYNNYIDTNTYFYPMGAVGSVDTANAKGWNGHILVNTPLPIQDSAFIVAVNKNLTKNDPALNPSTHLSATGSGSNSLPQSTQKVIALILLIVLALLLLFLMQRNKKSAGR